MNLLGPGKEFCNQLLFRDDRKFTTRKLPIEHSIVMEKKNEVAVNAWAMPYSVLKQYQGGYGIPKGQYLLSYGRDILFDPFDQLRPDEKPEKGKTLIKDSIKDQATSTVYRHSLGGKRSVMERLTVGVVAVMILLGLWVGLAIVLNRGA